MTRGATALCIAASLVSGAFSATICTDGVMQSPVNLKTCPAKPTDGKDKDETFNMPEERAPIKLNYGASQMEIEKVCSGTVGEVSCVIKLYPKSDAGTATNMMEVAGAEHARNYKLDHCTLRMPAEHLVNGRVAPLEVQCHHTMEKTGGKRKGILSTLYMASSAASGFVGAVADNLPTTAGTTGKKTAAASWTPTGTAGLTRYHSYAGSQTMGNCAEDVDWFIMYDPTGATQEQLDTLANSMTWMAARPVQDLYGREPEGCPTHHVGSAHGAASLSALMMVAALFFAFC